MPIPTFNKESLSFIPELTNPNYWFVRTDGGLYFDSFVEGGYIAINWNSITKADILSMGGSGEAIKNKIALTEKIDNSVKQGKMQVTGILSKLVRFKELNKGDTIIIPSHNSSRLAFGVIEDNEIYNDGNDVICPYIKRRKVNWVAIKNMQDLDPVFFQIKNSRHAISDIKRHSKYIDIVTNKMFFKNGYGHLVLNVKSPGDINLQDLLGVFEDILIVAKKINEVFEFEEEIEECSIKINIQSPGPAMLKLVNGSTLAILGLILFSSCNKLPISEQKKSDVVITSCSDSLNRAHERMRRLGIE